MQSIPDSMQAVVVDEHSQTLSVRQIPVPKVGAGQVLIRMAAAQRNTTKRSKVAERRNERLLYRIGAGIFVVNQTQRKYQRVGFHNWELGD